MPFFYLKLVAVLLPALLLMPGVEVTERVQQYEVKGATVAEIAAQLRTRGPSAGGRRFHALTQWEISWLHRQRDEGGQCRITTVTTYLEVTTTLPKWTPAPSAPAALTASWNRYFNALKAHEQGHKQLGIEAAREVQRRLSRTPAAATCKALNAAMYEAGNAAMAEYQKRSEHYDQQTRHGLTQGAVFP